MNPKIASLFYNSKFSDVKFLISPQETEIFAHKLILAISSSEFENLQNIVYLPEYTYNGFREFLRYIYTNEIILDEKNVIEVFQLSEKFKIKSLVKECANKIKYFLVTNKNCDFLANWLGIWLISEVKDELINYVGKNPLKYFNSENVLILEQNDLEKILKLDFVEATEADYYNLALMWSKSHCMSKNIETSDKNLRECLGDLFYLIRFPSMSSDEFEDCYGYTSELLTIDESLLILYFIRTGGGETKFCKNPRGILITGNENDFDFDSGSEYEEIQIHQSSRDQKCKKCFLATSLKREVSYKNFNSLSFYTNNDILLKGFTIRTIPDIYEKGIKKISIIVTTGWESIKSQILYNKSLKITESFTEEFFKHDLYFDHPIVIKEKVSYNFCFKIDEDDNSSLNKGVGYCVPVGGCVSVAEIIFQIRENDLFIHDILFERI